MPGKILSIDLGEDYITAIQVISGFKGYEVESCCSMPNNNGKGIDEIIHAISEQMDLRSDTCHVTIPDELVSFRNLKMPFLDRKKIQQALPFEIETMVPYASDDLIIDFSVHNRSTQDNSELLTVFSRKDAIADLLESLRGFGISPDILDIRSVPSVSWLLNQPDTPENGLFLEIGLKRCCMILFLKKKIALIRNAMRNSDTIPLYEPTDSNPKETDRIKPELMERSIDHLCKSIKETIHSFCWQGNTGLRPEKVYFSGSGALFRETENKLSDFLNMPCERLDIRKDKRIKLNSETALNWNPSILNNALALAVRDSSSKGHGFNLRRDGFELKKRYEGLRTYILKMGMVLTLIVLAFVLSLGIDSYYLSNQNDLLDMKMRAVFFKTFPERKTVHYPYEEMKSEINALKESSGVLPETTQNQRIIEILDDIAGRLPESYTLLVSNLIIDGESVRISGETDSFNTVDIIKSKLEPSDYFTSVTISSAKLDRSGKKIQFEMKLGR